jgi:hypothetical protein
MRSLPADMSQERLAMVRSVYEAWARGDFSVASIEQFADRGEALRAAGLA